jgi:hypothetical protein
VARSILGIRGQPKSTLPSPTPFSLLSTHRAALSHRSPLRSGQVRPGQARRETRPLAPHSTPEAPRSFGRYPAVLRRRGGDAAGNGGDGGRRRRYARRREPRLHQHLRHRHSDPGETPSPALRIVGVGGGIVWELQEARCFEE